MGGSDSITGASPTKSKLALIKQRAMPSWHDSIAKR